MENRRIYTIGETVYDIIFKNNQPVAARPGGAMLNSSISLGRLGLPVSFISELADDDIGAMILSFLSENDVDRSHSYIYKNGKTALALAFLDEQDEAHFNFYKHYPNKRFQVDLPEFNANDIVLFGSFAALTKPLRIPLMEILSRASQAGAIIIYDPNFRKAHLKELPALLPMIIENIRLSDMVRGSSTDFKHIFNAWNANEAYRHITEAGCQNMISTSAEDAVHLKTPNWHISIKAPRINPVSTVGAGDAFNAGLIYGLMKLRIGRDRLNSLKKQEWETLIEIGVAFGSTVCESYDNYISQQFALKIRNISSFDK